MNSHTRKALNKIIIIAFLLFLVTVGISFISRNNKTQITATSQFITGNPFDLSQIRSISQYRSCEGHNYSGYNAQGEKETYRTMKHYIEAIDTLMQTKQQLKVFAPFDGNISQIESDSRGSRVYLSPKMQSNGWDFVFFHIDLLPEFNNEGVEFVTGTHIGFANLTNSGNFDIAMKNFSTSKQLNGSPFHYMTQEVLSQYSDVGITLNNIIIPKEQRDYSPCILAPGESGRDASYARSEAGKSWVNLEK